MLLIPISNIVYNALFYWDESFLISKDFRKLNGYEWVDHLTPIKTFYTNNIFNIKSCSIFHECFHLITRKIKMTKTIAQAKNIVLPD